MAYAAFMPALHMMAGQKPKVSTIFMPLPIITADNFNDYYEPSMTVQRTCFANGKDLHLVPDPSNWNGMLISAIPFIITAMAQTAPVMSGDGGVDLSVGPLAGLVDALVVAVLAPHGFADPFSIAGASLLVGVLSGLLNGFMIAVVRVQPIIATLGTYLAYQGITLEMLPMAGGQAPGATRSSLARSSSSSRSGSPGSRSSGPPFGAICSRSAATRRRLMRPAWMSLRSAS